MCLPFFITSRANSVPMFGLPVASMMTSIRPAAASALRSWVTASFPASIAPSMALAEPASTMSARSWPARIAASIAASGLISEIAPMRIPGISATCTTMSVPICPAPANPMTIGPFSLARWMSSSANCGWDMTLSSLSRCGRDGTSISSEHFYFQKNNISRWRIEELSMLLFGSHRRKRPLPHRFSGVARKSSSSAFPHWMRLTHVASTVPLANTHRRFSEDGAQPVKGLEAICSRPSTRSVASRSAWRTPLRLPICWQRGKTRAERSMAA